jgi:hypothetical protein
LKIDALDIEVLIFHDAKSQQHLKSPANIDQMPFLKPPAFSDDAKLSLSRT